MHTVNMLEAKSTLSKLVDAVERGLEPEIVIARHGRPAARLLPVNAHTRQGTRLGVAKGQFVVPDSIDESNAEAARLFGVG
jgi:prevent-host-death family protein